MFEGYPEAARRRISLAQKEAASYLSALPKPLAVIFAYMDDQDNPAYLDLLQK